MSESFEFSIAPANIRDLAGLQRLEKTCFALDAWSFLDLVGVLTFPATLRLKALAGGEMIGFAAADIREQQVGWIITIGVLPPYRRLGVARALLQACEQHISVPRIRLCVRHSNRPALALYRSMGYAQVEIWETYYRGGESAVVMEKELAH